MTQNCETQVMRYRVLAGSCDGGPCPTLYVDDDTGDITVQGYVTDAPAGIPNGEDVVHIPAEAWRHLLAGLPVAMLVAAMWTGRRGRAAVRRPIEIRQR
jgi:hypothetical protein